VRRLVAASPPSAGCGGKLTVEDIRGTQEVELSTSLHHVTPVSLGVMVLVRNILVRNIVREDSTRGRDCPIQQLSAKEASRIPHTSG
jgi:predicted 2-oxoglutarate/Fe(II)-dependent dioxygenase YbiX